MQDYFSNGYAKLLLSLTFIAAIAALASVAVANLGHDRDDASYPEATISVNGEGEVTAVPDIGQFSFSVNAEGETAAEAQSTSAESMNTILAYLGEQGVAETDIKTEGYNLYPRYRYEQRICPAGSFCPPGEQVEDGYEVSQYVQVKVRDTDTAGEIIAGVGERGATNISGLDFTIDDTDALRAQARAAAIADAKAKAALLADQLDVKLYKIVGFYEEQGGGYPYYEERAMSFDVAEAAFAPELPVGEETTTVRVNITYEIKDRSRH